MENEMKTNKYDSSDIAAFYKEEILLTRITVDRLRQEALRSEESYSSLRMMKKFSDNKKKKLTNRCT